MRIRLPLATPSAAPAPIELRGPRRPAPDAIGVADTGDGADAGEFALRLADHLGDLGARCALRLLAYGARPSPGASLAARADLAYSCHAVDPSGALEPTIAPASGALSILVGAPALASFAPGLALLLGAQRPLSQWPPHLRRERASFHLELAGADFALARELAARLIRSELLRGR